ncbi:MAG: hypothetical protein MI862_22915, partial [Desulfobacterales bacterium]|nr:hypothetical protein [Desulfobacterales bacterium]
LIPMAVSIAFGLLFGTTITLLMLPSALYIIDDFNKMRERRKAKRAQQRGRKGSPAGEEITSPRKAEREPLPV